MVAFFDEFTKAYPDITMQSSIGESDGGRKIYSFEVSEDAGTSKEGNSQCKNDFDHIHMSVCARFVLSTSFVLQASRFWDLC